MTIQGQKNFENEAVCKTVRILKKREKHYYLVDKL
ncbi:hypothetical protein PRO82_001180 [Candidatus Protochlamydia amoebophila]|nr:hypothetical protein [Candidatus Protochlamydia amoebophila]